MYSGSSGTAQRFPGTVPKLSLIDGAWSYLTPGPLGEIETCAWLHDPRIPRSSGLAEAPEKLSPQLETR